MTYLWRLRGLYISQFSFTRAQTVVKWLKFHFSELRAVEAANHLNSLILDSKFRYPNCWINNQAYSTGVAISFDLACLAFESAETCSLSQRGTLYQPSPLYISATEFSATKPYFSLNSILNAEYFWQQMHVHRYYIKIWEDIPNLKRCYKNDARVCSYFLQNRSG